VTKEIINRGWLRLRIESKKTIAMIGPGDLRGFKVPFPASQIGKALRLGQEGFAVAKVVFDLFALGNVQRDSDQRQGLTGVIVERNGATMKQAHIAVGENASEFAIDDLMQGDTPFRFL